MQRKCSNSAILPCFSPSQTSELVKRISSQAGELREKLTTPQPDSEDLAYPFSFYTNKETGKNRGFCNWIIPNRLMVGQYPGQNPEKNGPSEEEAEIHLKNVIIHSDVSLFCCLQSEIPDQKDDIEWAKYPDGKVQLPYQYRSEFPNAFTPYSHLAQSICESHNHCNSISFIHAPIDDLNVPQSKEPFLELLLDILIAMNEHERTVYIHCWGGRGRTGLISGCLLSLIWPNLDAESILDIIQVGYSSRIGSNEMPPVLSRSPQTQEQRNFVRNFVAHYSNLNER